MDLAAAVEEINIDEETDDYSSWEASFRLAKFIFGPFSNGARRLSNMDTVNGDSKEDIGYLFTA